MGSGTRGVSLGLVAVVLGSYGARADEGEAQFEAKVRPVLAAHCVKCHGATKASGGLRLDSRGAMLKGGESGPAVVPGDPAGSLLVRAIGRADDDLKMPPSKPLPKGVLDDLAAWVAAGAVWPAATASGGKPPTIPTEGHWAFGPLKTPTPPDDPTGWAEGVIDRWVAAGHRAHGVKPVRQADRRTLIRRVTFDLTGLPPSPERVEAFAAEDRPDASERLVDELLASPRYGERWGRYWLDLARYADTAGDNSDYPVPEAYLYRDYVIEAFNADLPYDRFLHEQIAGDVLAKDGPPADYARRVVATGFLAQSKRFGTRKLEDVHQIIEDTLNTTGQVVLGLSLRCARCHDHKFDPVPTRDYYALYGLFAGTKYPFAGAEGDHKPSEFAPLVPPDVVAKNEAEYAANVARLKAEITRLGGDPKVSDRGASGKVRTVSRKAEEKLPANLSEEARAAIRSLRDELSRLEKAGPLAGVPLAYAVREGTPTDSKVQKGGDPRKLGDVVPRGVLTCLDPPGKLPIASGSSGRLEFARWLTDGAARPLTARVMANRVWQQHFGKPLVATPSDFGLRGTPPTHPELLDALASSFVASGWSVKALHRQILLSKTYRLSADRDPANEAADGGNAWYARADRRRLDAEAMRDALLDLGGALDPSRPGPHPFPPVSQWKYSAHRQFKAVYPSNHRSVYLMVQRLHPHPYLALFNGPDTSVTTAVRDGSSVPLQSLFLMNSPFVHEQAAGFARGLLAAEPDPEARLDRAYLRVLARRPTDAERSRALAFLARYEGSLAAEGVAADRRPAEAWAAFGRALFASNEFAFVD